MEPPIQATAWSRLGTGEAQAVCRVQAGLLRHLREILDERGHVEVLSPIIGPVTDPGIRGAKQVTIDYYGHRYKVMSSAILYKQLMLHALPRVYMVAPCVRLEPLETATTGRHLTEFYQVDVEIRGGGLKDATDAAEHLVAETVERIWRTHRDDLKLLGAKEWKFQRPFPHLRHREAVARLAKEGFTMEPHVEIPWDGERVLSGLYDSPLLVTHYPRGSRGFYDRESTDEPGLLLDFDVLYPGGYGEAVSGAEREHAIEKVVGRMREGGEDPKKYGWYLDMLRDGTPGSAGFGIGVERLTRFVCGLQDIAAARPFPKLAGVVSP